MEKYCNPRATEGESIFLPNIPSCKCYILGNLLDINNTEHNQTISQKHKLCQSGT